MNHTTISNKHKVYYIYSDKLLEESSKNPAVINRSKMNHELIKSYKLLSHMQIIQSFKCCFSQLRNFHSIDYCETLKNSTEDDDMESYGLAYDCPIWPEFYEYICEIAGSTITICQQIIADVDAESSIYINWFGGWHHAQRDKAAGYCYVNDIVLGILILRQKFDRVLYIDLDVHHGDGVQSAFETTKRVLTLSFHQYEPGFYPGSGNIDDCGFGAGRGYSINFPYKSGINGKNFIKYFQRIFSKVSMEYEPQILVIQCGGDAITGDPLGNSNLTPNDLKKCIKFCLDKNLPTLLLGGGGYNFPNTSRYWTELTALACQIDLSVDIPDNEYFLEYSPSYELIIDVKNIKDFNDEIYLEQCSEQIEDILNKFNVCAI